MKRTLFLCAYDIASPRRLRHSLKVLKDYAGGGQKSVFECFLSVGEKTELLERMEQIMNTKDDTFFILPLRANAQYRSLGMATPCQDGDFYWVG